MFKRLQRTLGVTALTALLLLLLVAPGGAQCPHRGAHVILYSNPDNPNVLMWDSRFRLRDYHAATFDEAQQLLPHAVLVPPGARATVESCVPGFVGARLLEAPGDAIGLILNSGPMRDRRGWVLGSDVRPATVWLH